MDPKTTAPTILITRPLVQAEYMAAKLKARGIPGVIAPLLEVVPYLEAEHPVKAAIAEKPQLMVATSANALRTVTPWVPASIPVITVGEDSAEVAKQCGFLKVTQAGGNSKALVESIVASVSPGKGMLLYPRAQETQGNIRAMLERHHFHVKEIIVYHTIPATSLPAGVIMGFKQGVLPGVVLCSTKTARVFVSLVHKYTLGACMEKVTALCLSADIGKVLAALPMGAVAVAPRADNASLLGLIDTFCKQGK